MERNEPRSAILLLMDALAKLADDMRPQVEENFAEPAPGEAVIPLSGGRKIAVAL